MTRHPLTAAATFVALVSCGESDPGNDHDHGHEHAEGTPVEAPAAPAPVQAAAAAPQPFALGAWTAALEPDGAGLRLTVRDPTGAPVAPSGEARVVLTGTGEAEQRVVLAPAEGGWAGAARATGAAGYVAVVSVELDGRTETARVSWGSVPEVAPAPKPEAPAPDEGDAHGHGHDHGH